MNYPCGTFLSPRSGLHPELKDVLFQLPAGIRRSQLATDKCIGTFSLAQKCSIPLNHETFSSRFVLIFNLLQCGFLAELSHRELVFSVKCAATGRIFIRGI
jgi:hypothetical protein